MSQPEQREREMWTFPTTTPTRVDSSSADLVEQGVKLQDIRGTDCAAEYLKTNGIEMEVAMRVLARPSERRRHRGKSGKLLTRHPHRVHD